MAVTITGNGGLFTRLGLLAGASNDLYALAGATATTYINTSGRLPTRYDAFQVAFSYSPVSNNVLNDLFSTYVEAGRSSFGQLAGVLAEVAAAIAIQQCNADTTLAELSLTYAFRLLQAQFAGNYNLTTSSLAAGAQTAVGSPVGTTIINMSVLRGDGLTLEYGYPETIRFTCTEDANGGATENNEPFNILGMQSPEQAYQWPLGSGTNTSLNVVDAESDYPDSGNLLVNSDMETVTNTNIPDNWIVLTGARATEIFAGASNPYTGSNSLYFLGVAGLTLTAVYQAFDTTSSTTLGAGGTPYALLERTMYGLSVWLKVDSTPAAGVLTFSLTDSSGNVLNDDAGNANTITQDLTAISSTYVNLKGYFRTPTNLPSTVWLRIKLTTAITNGRTVYIDHLSMGVGTSLYGTLPQGPYCTIHSGDTAPRSGDAWTVAMTTNMAKTTWQGALQLLFNIAQLQSATPGLGIRMQTTGGSTVNANLIA